MAARVLLNAKTGWGGPHPVCLLELIPLRWFVVVLHLVAVVGAPVEVVGIGTPAVRAALAGRKIVVVVRLVAVEDAPVVVVRVGAGGVSAASVALELNADIGFAGQQKELHQGSAIVSRPLRDTRRVDHNAAGIAQKADIRAVIGPYHFLDLLIGIIRNELPQVLVLGLRRAGGCASGHEEEQGQEEDHKQRSFLHRKSLLSFYVHIIHDIIPVVKENFPSGHVERPCELGNNMVSYPGIPHRA